MKEHYERYGYTCSEANLATLPSTAPQAVKDLTKWLTLEGRRSSLEEYLGVVQPDSRIHGKFWHIGAWTQRMSHSNPNQANIPSVPHGDPQTPVEEIKHKYDGRIRSLFQASPGCLLVGTDADAIQLRILAHYMEDADFIMALESGKKEDGTDAHTLNMKKLGAVCKDRDTAKTFIYAWLLGAGTDKVAQILDCNRSQAKDAVDRFIASYPGLNRLKKVIIPRDAKRGYFIGLDGRKVACDSEHLMLAGYLQSGEAIVMKRALGLWHMQLTDSKTSFKIVDFVHDEWVTEIKGGLEEAERVGYVQRSAIASVGVGLGLKCKLEGTTKIGKTWKDVH